MLVLFWH